MKQKTYLVLVFALVLILLGVYAARAWTPLLVEDDPLVRMPGTQPGQVTLEDANRCLNCHAGYDTEVEPGFNWQGSMMAQASRDPLFWACLTVAAQDSIWAVDRPNATDICERCHFPQGWLEGLPHLPAHSLPSLPAEGDGVAACRGRHDQGHQRATLYLFHRHPQSGQDGIPSLVTG